MKKRIYCCALLLLMTVILAATVSAEDALPALSLESVNTVPAKDTLIEVDLVLENNPGMVSLTVPITWDEDLFRLVEVNNNENVIPEWYGMPDLTGVTDKYYAAWNNDTYQDGNFTDNGVLCTLVLQLKRDMEPGETANISIDNKDELLSIMNFDMEDYSRGEVAGSSFLYTDGVVTSSDENFTISGTVKSSGSETDETHIELIDAETNEVVKELNVAGTSTNYCFTEVEPGTYIIRVSKKNHVPREYKISVG